MKKNLFISMLVLISIFFQNNVLGQNKLKFETLPKERYENLSKQFKEYKICSLDRSSLATLNSGEQVSIETDKRYDFVLKENHLFSPNYIVSIRDDKGVQTKKLKDLNFEGRFYSGAGQTKNQSLSLSSYNENYCIHVKTKDADFFIEPLKKYSKKAKDNEYVYYESKNAMVPEGAKLENDVINSANNQNRNPETSSTATIPNCKTVDLALAIDYSTFAIQGSNINLAIYYSAYLINLSQSNFSTNNGLTEDIHFRIIEHRINTTETCNFWDIDSTIGLSILYSFTEYVRDNSMFSTTDYDIPIYISQYRAGDGILGATNSVNSLCLPDEESWHHGITSTVMLSINASVDAKVISHEIGHVFGCEHDTSSSNIMNSSTNFASNWNTTGLDIINDQISTASCLSACEYGICESIQLTNLNYSVDALDGEVTFSWVPEIWVWKYKARLYDFSTDSWTSYTEISGADNSVTFDYSQVHCQDKYKFEIIPICSEALFIEVPGTIKQIAFDIMGQAPEPVIVINYDTPPGGGNQCQSKPSFYKATGTDWGTSPSFQWKLNGSPVGTDQNTLSVLAANGDIVTCEVTSSDSCVLDPTVTSNAIEVSLAAPVTPMITLTEMDVCGLYTSQGAISPTTMTNTGTAPTFEWYVNSVPSTDADGAYFYGIVNNGDTVSVTMTSSDYCVTTPTTTDSIVIDCDVTLNVKFFIEGFYISDGEMEPVLLNQGVSGAIIAYTDDAVVELRDPIDYHLVATQPSVVTTTGQCQVNFSGLATTGVSYYIVIKHRNALQTWSALPVAISGFYNTYDFTTDDSQAYGNNMAEVESGIWAIYSGDINQDESIDNTDTDDLYDDITNFAFGYQTTDINGDGAVDGSDTTHVLNNISNSVYSMHP